MCEVFFKIYRCLSEKKKKKNTCFVVAFLEVYYTSVIMSHHVHRGKGGRKGRRSYSPSLLFSAFSLLTQKRWCSSQPLSQLCTSVEAKEIPYHLQLYDNGGNPKCAMGMRGWTMLLSEIGWEKMFSMREKSRDAAMSYHKLQHLTKHHLYFHDLYTFSFSTPWIL